MIAADTVHHALTALRSRSVAILGYGAQGAAQALCLRDSGIDVRVGLPADHADVALAEAEGLRVVDPEEACEESDVVMLLAPAEQQQALFDEVLAGSLVRGDVLLVADGFALRYGLITPPAGVDVGLVQPVGDPATLRQEFAEGRGVPVMVAVAQDESGDAWSDVLGYAAALGGARAGVVETTVAQAVDAATFGAAAVVDGGIATLMRDAYDTLTAAGYGDDIAYLACVHQAKAAVDAIYAQGIAAHAAGLEPWAGYAAAFGPRENDGEALRELLGLVQDGTLARAFLADEEAGGAERIAARDEAARHPSEAVGERLRGMMPWLRHADPRAGQRWR